MKTQKIKKVCNNCKQNDVILDAKVKWNVEKQKYTIVSVDASGFCLSCGGHHKTSDLMSD